MPGRPLAPGTYAIGVSVAGVAAIGAIAALLALNGIFYGEYYYSFTIFALSLAISGWLGGWLCWKWIAKPPMLSVERAVRIAVTTAVVSLLIGAILSTLAFALLRFAGVIGNGWRQALGALWDALLFGFVFGPIYAVVVFGLPFLGLVLIWTLWRRRIVNRAA